MKYAIAFLAIVSGLSIAQAGSTKSDHKDIELQVTEKGFEPSQIDVKPGTNVVLNVTRRTDNTCAGEITIPDRDITKTLPLNKTIVIKLGKLNKGEIRFACGMKMVKGLIIVR